MFTVREMTEAWETALQTAVWRHPKAGRQPIALRDFSKQGFGEGRIQCNQELLYKGFLLVTLKGLSAFCDMKRCEDWDPEVSS